MQLRSGLHIVAVLALLGVAAFPIYWMLVTSLTPPAEIFADDPRMVPDLDRIPIFLSVFSTIPIGAWLRNSAIVAAGTTVLSIALALLPAYALSRFKFRGKGLLGLGLFASQMLPEVMLVVPLYAIFVQLRLLDTLAGLILVNTAFTVPVVTWIVKGAIDSVPIEMEEAARIDGCSRLQILSVVLVPLIAPTLAAASVIAFFHGWNEYVFALTFVNTEALHTASVGLAGFVGELITPIEAVMTVAIIYTMPSIIFYLFAQRYVVAGITSGAVKG